MEGLDEQPEGVLQSVRRNKRVEAPQAPKKQRGGLTLSDIQSHGRNSLTDVNGDCHDIKTCGGLHWKNS